tara:strand:+ start:1566 stop:1823 length:258 start_codon:yes stop_codon:yes gene_type:complete
MCKQQHSLPDDRNVTGLKRWIQMLAGDDSILSPSSITNVWVGVVGTRVNIITSQVMFEADQQIAIVSLHSRNFFQFASKTDIDTG